MDVLAEILPPSYLVKSENTAKDRQQKNKQNKKNKSLNAYNTTKSELSSVAEQDNRPKLDIDRRSGEDRRETQQNRGRWLESRAKKDRRKDDKATAIQLKV